jgi:pyruvate dehydrogenase E2 component (dihydrolipoamide acetyltransferase)
MGWAFSLPDLGEGLHDAEVVAWHVSVGDHVVTDQPLVTVETDKAMVEVPSPRSGYIALLHAEPGELIEVGQPLVEFSDDAAADSGAIVGEIAKAESGSHARAAIDAHTRRTGAVGVAAAPAVRRLADSLGVDLATLEGTGVGGSLTQHDVEAAAGADAPGRHPDGSAPGKPLRGVRRAMLRNMTRAGREVVRATVTDEADIESWSDAQDVTARLIRALVAGCRAAPSLNAWFDSSSETRLVHERIDLGVAVETEEGLFAPVITDVGSRDLADLRRQIEVLKTAVEARSLGRQTLGRQSITLSNFGMFGGRFADLVVVPPQVAILGAGRAQPRPVAVAGDIKVHRLLPLSLSFDHRVVTGVEATRFLGAVIADLERNA